MAEQPLTIGIEEEFQIVDAGGQLKAHIDTLLAAAQSSSIVDDVRAEMLQSVVEVGTRICANVGEAGPRCCGCAAAWPACSPEGLRIASAGTHPFSHWQDQRVTEMERYKLFEDQMQDLVRELLIFGMHVHVGIADPEARIEVMNEARYFLPPPARPVDLQPVLAEPADRAQVVPQRDLVAVPAQRHPARVQLPGRLRQLRGPAGQDQHHRHGKSIWWDLRPTGSTRHRVPHLRRRDQVDEVICLAALSRPSAPSCSGCGRRTSASASTRRS
jgi:carboxylate-amine ligase